MRSHKSQTHLTKGIERGDAMPGPRPLLLPNPSNEPILQHLDNKQTKTQRSLRHFVEQPPKHQKRAKILLIKKTKPT